MNSYFDQGGFYGQGGTAGATPDYRFPIGLGGLGGVTAYSQHQAARAVQDPTGGYESPASPSKSSLYSSLSDPSSYSKIECKEQNGYPIKPDIGATGGGVPGWGSGGVGGALRPSVCTPDMTRYTPSSVDARDRAWMNTCSSLSAAAQVTQPPSQLQQPSPHQTFYPWMAIADFSEAPTYSPERMV